MRNAGGFEGNAHTLRILSRLEHYSSKDGSNLTRRTLLGVLKYPAPYSKVNNDAMQPCMDEHATSIRIIDRKKSTPPKCFLDSEQDVVDWILSPLTDDDRRIFQSISACAEKHYKPRYRSLDSSIVDVADDIAYGVHDLEDAVALDLISIDVFRKYVTKKKCGLFLDAMKNRRPVDEHDDIYDRFVRELFAGGTRSKRIVGELVNYFVTNTTIVEREQFEEPLIRYNARLDTEQHKFLRSLKDIVARQVIESPNVQHLEFKGQKMVVSVFEALKSDPKSFLPADPYSQYEAANTPRKKDRVICDYVAGMTDRFLIKTYDRLFSPRMGSVFDRLSSQDTPER